MIQNNVLEDTFRNPRLLKGLRKTFAGQQRLCGVFEDHAVARHQGRNDGIDCSEIRIIPRRNDHNNAERNVLYITAETILCVGT